MPIPREAIKQALELLPEKMDSTAARVMLVAIGLQESRFAARRQLVGNPPRPTGPAAGFWQFEKGGGVKGVLNHKAARVLAAKVCAARGVKPETSAVWGALQHDDVLAAAFARLLLYSDPKPLPHVGDAQGAWDLYIRTWRPGKPHRQTWDALYERALKC